MVAVVASTPETPGGEKASNGPYSLRSLGRSQKFQSMPLPPATNSRACFCCGVGLDEEQLRACPDCEQLSPTGTTTGFRLRGQAFEDSERLS